MEQGLRKYKLLHALNVLLSILFIISFIGVFPILFIPQIESKIWCILPFFLAVAIGLTMGKIVQPKMKQCLLENVFIPKLRSTFFDFKYEKTASADLNLLNCSNLLDLSGNVSIKDRMLGTYNGTHFEAFTLQIDRHYTGASNNRTTLFYGQWYVFDFEKYKEIDSVICTTKLFITSSFFPHRDNKVKTFDYLINADEEFKNSFIVEADDEDQVKAVLTNQTMFLLTKIKQEHPHVAMGFSFNYGKLHIGLYTNHEMIPPISYRKLQKIGVNNYANSCIQNITTIIDLLN